MSPWRCVHGCAPGASKTIGLHEPGAFGAFPSMDHHGSYGSMASTAFFQELKTAKRERDEAQKTLDEKNSAGRANAFC